MDSQKVNNFSISDENIVKAKELHNSGDFQKAKDLLETILEVNRNNSDFHLDRVAEIKTNLALVLRDLKEFEVAEKVFDEVLEYYKINPPAKKATIADLNYYIALVLNDLGKFENAKKRLEITLKIDRSHLEHDNIEIAKAERELAFTLHNLGELENAINIFKVVIKKYRKHYEQDDIQIAKIEMDIGILLYDMENYEEAKKYLENALISYKKKYENGNIAIAHLKFELGKTLNQLGQYFSTLDLFEDCLKAYETEFGPHDKKIANVCFEMAILHYNYRDNKQAKEHFEKVIRIIKKIPENVFSDFDKKDLAICYKYLGNIYYNLKQYSDAKEHFEIALTKFTNLYNDSDLIVLNTQLEFSLVLKKLGEIYKAKEISSKSYLQISQKYGPHAPSTEYAKKILKKIYGYINYRKIKNAIDSDAESFVKSGGWTYDFQIYSLIQKKRATTKFLLIFLSALLLAIIFMFYKSIADMHIYSTIRFVFSKFFTYFFYLTIFNELVFILAKIKQLLRTYGIRGLSYIKIIIKLRNRQTKKLFEIKEEYRPGDGPMFKGFEINLLIVYTLKVVLYFSIGIFMIILWNSYYYSFLLPLGFIFIIYCIIETLMILRPPFCLLLATSKDQTINLQGRIETSFNYLGVASLLEQEGEKVKEKHGIDTVNIYRTREDIEWMTSVKELIDIVPIIIVDGRYLSQAVTKEIEYLFSSNPADKILFIVVNMLSDDPIFDNIYFKTYMKKNYASTLILSEAEVVQTLFFFYKYIYHRNHFKKLNFSELKLKFPEILEASRKLETSIKRRREKISGHWKNIFFWLSIKLKK